MENLIGLLGIKNDRILNVWVRVGCGRKNEGNQKSNKNVHWWSGRTERMVYKKSSSGSTAEKVE